MTNVNPGKYHKNSIHIYTFLIWILCFNIHAQSWEEKINWLNEISNETCLDSIEKWVSVYDNNKEDTLAWLYRFKGKYENRLRDYPSSVLSYQIADSLFFNIDEEKYSTLLSQIRYFKGLAAYRAGDVFAAKKYYREGIDLKVDDKFHYKNLYALADIYHNEGDYITSHKYLDFSINLLELPNNRSYYQELINVMLLKSDVLYYQKKWQQSLIPLIKAEQLIEKNKESMDYYNYDMARTADRFSYRYRELKKYKLAKDYIYKSHNLNSFYNDETNIHKAELYEKLGNLNIRQGHYDEAIFYHKKRYRN